MENNINKKSKKEKKYKKSNNNDNLFNQLKVDTNNKLDLDTDTKVKYTSDSFTNESMNEKDIIDITNKPNNEIYIPNDIELVNKLIDDLESVKE